MKKFYLVALLLLSAIVIEAREVGLMNTENYKYKVAKQVFEKLIAAKGDKQMQVPEFVMSTEKRYVAWIDNRKIQIGLEEAAYNICISYGEDSLNTMAALIAHEITHYYEKHSWGKGFTTAFIDLDISEVAKMTSKSTNIKMTNEAEANYLGGFLAYSAGFQTFGVMPKFLVDVYSEYDLPEKIPGYPSLDDRLKLAVESEIKLEELIHIFDAANYMIILQQYSIVSDYYSYILKEFQSRKIYNNAGVINTMAALQLFDKNAEQLKYTYPIQLDGEIKMSKPKIRSEAFGSPKEVEKRKELLKKAKFYFEQARSLDAEYTTGLINLACVYDLIGSYEEASFFAKKAAKIARNHNNIKTEGDAYIIRGIAAIHENEPENGADYFMQAAAKDKDCEPLAQYNMDAYSEILSDVAPPRPRVSLTEEKIENINLNAFMKSIDVDILLAVKGNMACGVKFMAESKILLNLIDGGQSGYTLLHLTNSNYKGSTSDGIKLGTYKKDIIAKYGQPTFVQETRQGKYLVYDFKNIAFFISDGQVKNWALYRIQEEKK